MRLGAAPIGLRSAPALPSHLPDALFPRASPRSSPSAPPRRSPREPTSEQAFSPRQLPAALSPRRVREGASSPTSTELRVNRLYTSKQAPSADSRHGHVALHTPSGREEVRAMANRLQGALNAGDCTHADAVWSSVFSELVRQVQVHTAERGELLEMVRAQYEGKVKVLRERTRKQEAQLKKLQVDYNVLFGAGEDEQGEPGSAAVEAGAAGAPLDAAPVPVVAGPRAGTPGLSAIAATALSQGRREKRLRMMLDAGRAMRAVDRAELGLALMQSDGDVRGCGNVIAELLASLPTEQRATLLAKALLTLPPTDAVSAWAIIADGSSDQARTGIFSVVGRLMSDVEREAQLIEMMAAAEPSLRANISAGMLSNLPTANRQDSIVRILRKLPRHERTYILTDSFHEVNATEVSIYPSIHLSISSVAGNPSPHPQPWRRRSTSWLAARATWIRRIYIYIYIYIISIYTNEYLHTSAIRAQLSRRLVPCNRRSTSWPAARATWKGRTARTSTPSSSTRSRPRSAPLCWSATWWPCPSIFAARCSRRWRPCAPGRRGQRSGSRSAAPCLARSRRTRAEAENRASPPRRHRHRARGRASRPRAGRGSFSSS